MSAIWLEKLSLDRLVAGEPEIDTEIPFSEFTRLAAVVLPESSNVVISATIRETSKGIVLVDGTVNAELQLTCQRCLDAMPLLVDSPIKLGLLRREGQEAFLPTGYESLLVGEEEVRLADLFEDEILLELPIAPRHADQKCSPLNNSALQDSSQKTSKPFADLADILRKSH